MRGKVQRVRPSLTEIAGYPCRNEVLTTALKLTDGPTRGLRLELRRRRSCSTMILSPDAPGAPEAYRCDSSERSPQKLSSRAEPLLPGTPNQARPSPLNLLWALVNLLATLVGAGMLSLPISFAYCGSAGPAMLLLLFFCALSAASFNFIFGAALRMEAPSYLSLGEMCFGPIGGRAVLISLLALLASAFVQVTIIVIDVWHMLLDKYTSLEPDRLVVTGGVLLLAVPLCLPRELLQLTFASSLSVACSLFTCGSIVSNASTVHSMPPSAPVLRILDTMPLATGAFCPS